MGATIPAIDDTRLSHFSPLDRLPSPLLEELLAHSTIERLPPGRRLFNRDDADSRALYLLSGQLALISGDNTAVMLKADSREAYMPIDHHNPHQFTALARTSVTVLSIDADILAGLLDRSVSPGPLTSPAGGGDEDADIGPLFSSPMFARVPKPYLQALRRQMKESTFPAGEQLVRAGELARHYYIIKTGSFSVSRRPGHHCQRDLPGKLGPGDGIGEDALITSGRYDATATATETSRVLRIAKREFMTLVVRPSIRWISCHDMSRMQPAGVALVDVRSLRAYNRRHLPGSINLPLKMLRQTAPLFDRGLCYIVCSDKAKSATIAAFLLARLGMDVKILKEGLGKASSTEQCGEHAGTIRDSSGSALGRIDGGWPISGPTAAAQQSTHGIDGRHRARME